ncbi:MAG: RICIN domain-containing protein [Candidatus Sphingomonas phytovorans]|nr:RICIN domain-containing protein [Sphingomonas sp.]WEJ98438.1 MAG: RICIN domain-containing protein [Sphingomonas sp.]
MGTLLLFGRAPGAAPGSPDGTGNVDKGWIEAPRVDLHKESVDGSVVQDTGQGGLSADRWVALPAFLDQARHARGAVDALGLPGGGAPAFPALWASWGRFTSALDQWQATRDALVALANDIVSYATVVVPQSYGRIEGMLNDGASVDAIAALLGEAIAQAGQRADRARALAAAIAPPVAAINDLAGAFHAVQRNPPTRITLRSAPSLCLAYDGNGDAVVSNTGGGDNPAQHWTIEPVRMFIPGWVFRTATGDRTLTVPAGDTGEREGSRPRLIQTGQAGPNGLDGGAAVFIHYSSGYLQPGKWSGHTLDCAGNSGWNSGTPVLCWEQNDGDNQKWSFTARSLGDLDFYDAIAPVVTVSGSGLSALQHLEGDWRAVADDLGDGLAQLRGVDSTAGFIGGLQIESVTGEWADLAREAQAAIALL